ncbi:MAG: undecaprenyldiphospho-muramoylpentapeptide beta-N-acetylglucosaminyltransferase [Clostridia bacterium]|nr:undecaprenyldiphospho-muramoylpentapeptide beta-N-acetylglucosaminyltransferase [Clostridia bacterium]
MKVLFSCGGTGGHINPAIAIANTVKLGNKDAEILFVGTKNGMEQKLVTKAGYEIEFVKARGFKRKLSLSNIDAAIKAVTSVFAAKKIIKRFKPDVVIGTGGYASWAAVKAAAKLGVPTLIHEQNAFPGVTTKQLAKYADRICLSFDGTEKYFTPEQREKAVITGNPLKPEIENADRKKARQALGIGENEIYIVSFGGSLGAEKVNEFCFELIDSYIRNTAIRYYHATGSGGFEKYSAIAKEKGFDKLSNVKIEEYIYDMDKHLAAADLLICRAGAITLAELCVMGRPSILIPSPNVTDDHQYKNAKALADKEAAVVFRESELDGKKLTEEVKRLVNDGERLKRIGANAKAFGRPNAAKRICEMALELIKK